MATARGVDLNRLVTGQLEPFERSFLAAIDLDYALRITEKVASFGTYRRGFRPTGSEAGAATAHFLKEEMERLGLQNVHLQPFPVDGWHFAGARVQVMDASGRVVADLEASSYGGAGGTAADGIEAELVYVGCGTEADYARVDATGRIVLAELDYETVPWPGIALRQAKHHGAAGLILFTTRNFAQIEDALHCFDLQGPTEPPVVNIARKDGEALAARLKTGEKLRVHVWSSARVNPQSTGYNVVGYIPGSECPDEFVIIGDHFDAWFEGYVDNASGVAGCLTIAKAVLDSGYRPRRTLVFVLHDAEEYGKSDVPFDWCIGAYYQILNHPEWAGRTAGVVIFELSGDKDAQEMVWFVSPDLATLAGRIQARLRLDQVYPQGARLSLLPTTWEDTWAYTARGIPSVANLETHVPYRTHIYHTQYDRADRFNPQKYAVHLAGLGLMALQLDHSDVVPLDMAQVAAELRRRIDGDIYRRAGVDDGELLKLIDALAERGQWINRQIAGRGPFPEGARTFNNRLLAGARVLNERLTRLGGNTGDTTLYPHEHAQKDFLALDSAVAALEAGDVQQALQWLSQVQGMAWGRNVSHQAYREHLFGYADHPQRDWFWGNGRFLPYTDVWHQYRALALHGSETEAVARVRGELVELREQVRAQLHEATQDLCRTLRLALEALPQP